MIAATSASPMRAKNAALAIESERVRLTTGAGRQSQALDCLHRMEQSATIDHAGASEQCSSGGGGGGGGSYIEVSNCADSSTHIVDDYGGIAPSTGDVISYYHTSWMTVYCGTVTATGVGGTANYYSSSSYSDCDEATTTKGYG